MLLVFLSLNSVCCSKYSIFSKTDNKTTVPSPGCSPRRFTFLWMLDRSSVIHVVSDDHVAEVLLSCTLIDISPSCTWCALCVLCVLYATSCLWFVAEKRVLQHTSMCSVRQERLEVTEVTDLFFRSCVPMRLKLWRWTLVMSSELTSDSSDPAINT